MGKFLEGNHVFWSEIQTLGAENLGLFGGFRVNFKFLCFLSSTTPRYAISVHSLKYIEVCKFPLCFCLHTCLYEIDDRTL